MARPHDAVLGFVPGVAGMHDVDDYPRRRPVPGLLVYRYDSPLFFANAEDFRTRALAAVDGVATARSAWFVLNTEAIVEVDITAADALEALRSELADRGIVFALARVKQDLRDGPAPDRPDRPDRRGARVPHAAHGGRGLPPVERGATLISPRCDVREVRPLGGPGAGSRSLR